MPAGRTGWGRNVQESHNSSLIPGNVSFYPVHFRNQKSVLVLLLGFCHWKKISAQNPPPRNGLVPSLQASPAPQTARGNAIRGLCPAATLPRATVVTIEASIAPAI